MPTQTRPTIRQVAKMCGVSAMTVSAVINNKPGQMSAETRERVLKAVRELGYRPTPAHWKPKTREILTLGVIAGVPGESLVGANYHGTILHGIVAAADQLGQNVTFFTNNLLAGDPHRNIRVYCDDRCDGLIVIAPSVGSELIKALRERGFPLVVIGDQSDFDDVSFIDVDNISEGYTTTSYLVQQGHRRIAHVRGPVFVRSANQRVESFQRALAEQGIQPDNAWVIRTDTLREELSSLLRLPANQRPTALFCWEDDVAVAAIELARGLGLTLPDDLSIIGFNDMGPSSLIPSFLTTTRQPYEQISHRAMEMLIALTHGEARGPLREFLPTKLIIRQSVTSPPLASR